MGSIGGKKRPHSGGIFLICSSVVAKCGKDSINVCKNKLFEYDDEETWSDVLNNLLDR